MQCAVHPETEASGPCAVCFQNLCDACTTFERDGSPRDALSPELIRHIFAVDAEWLSRESGKGWIAYGE